MHTDKLALTIEEASEYTGIGRNTMRMLVDWKKIPVLKVGRKTIIKRETLEEFILLNENNNLRIEDEVIPVFHNAKKEMERGECI
jgi:excisionase family DNA binding protein